MLKKLIAYKYLSIPLLFFVMCENPIQGNFPGLSTASIGPNMSILDAIPANYPGPIGTDLEETISRIDESSNGNFDNFPLNLSAGYNDDQNESGNSDTRFRIVLLQSPAKNDNNSDSFDGTSVDVLQFPNDSSSTEHDFFDGTPEGVGNFGLALPPALALLHPAGNDVPPGNNPYSPEDIGEPKSIRAPEPTTIILFCFGLVGVAAVKRKASTQISTRLLRRQLQQEIIFGEFSYPQAPA